MHQTADASGNTTPKGARNSCHVCPSRAHAENNSLIDPETRSLSKQKPCRCCVEGRPQEARPKTRPNMFKTPQTPHLGKQGKTTITIPRGTCQVLIAMPGSGALRQSPTRRRGARRTPTRSILSAPARMRPKGPKPACARPGIGHPRGLVALTARASVRQAPYAQRRHRRGVRGRGPAPRRATRARTRHLRGGYPCARRLPPPHRAGVAGLPRRARAPLLPPDDEG